MMFKLFGILKALPKRFSKARPLPAGTHRSPPDKVPEKQSVRSSPEKVKKSIRFVIPVERPTDQSAPEKKLGVKGRK